MADQIGGRQQSSRFWFPPWTNPNLATEPARPAAAPKPTELPPKPPQVPAAPSKSPSNKSSFGAPSRPSPSAGRAPSRTSSGTPGTQQLPTTPGTKQLPQSKDAMDELTKPAAAAPPPVNPAASPMPVKSAASPLPVKPTASPLPVKPTTSPTGVKEAMDEPTKYAALPPIDTEIAVPPSSLLADTKDEPREKNLKSKEAMDEPTKYAALPPIDTEIAVPQSSVLADTKDEPREKNLKSTSVSSRMDPPVETRTTQVEEEKEQVEKRHLSDAQDVEDKRIAAIEKRTNQNRVKDKEIVPPSREEKKFPQKIASLTENMHTVGETSTFEEQGGFHKEIKESIGNMIQKINLLQQQNQRGGSEQGVSIITLAGENRGAYMLMGQEADGVISTVPSKKGEKLCDDAGNDVAIATRINSNVQSLNNSLLISSSCSERDPGVHFFISKKPKPEKEDKKHGKESV